MPKLDLQRVEKRTSTGYPEPFAKQVSKRSYQRLGEAGGLTQFGVNLTQLQPGAWSSQRHWHSTEDEFVYVVSGEIALVTDEGEQILRAGDCAAFPANTPNGHHLINRSDTVVSFLAVGSKNPAERCVYPDIDMIWDAEADAYLHRDGTPYPAK